MSGAVEAAAQSNQTRDWGQRQQLQQQQQSEHTQMSADGLVGSPFPPMSPILEPVDRSVIFDEHEDLEDLWHAFNLIVVGDEVHSMAVRKVQREST